MPLVTQRLKSDGVAFETLFHQPTFHARDEAHRLGLPLDEVVKTILIKTEKGYALAVIPSSDRLDMHRVHRALGEPNARLATEHEILERFPAYPLGALPPLSSELDIPIYIDPQMTGHGSIVFATSQSESIRVRTEHVLAGATTCIAPLAVRPWARELDAVGKDVELRSSIEIDEDAGRPADPV